MNTLKILVNKYIKLNNLKRSELVVNLGYKNITGGLRKLDQFIDNPTFDSSIRLPLISILKIPPGEIDLAISQYQKYIEGEDRKRFKPFIQTIVSARPSPIFVAALAPKLWNISIDKELQLLDYHDEINSVIQTYQQLQLEHAKSKGVDNYSELVKLLTHYDDNNEPYSWMLGKGFRYFRCYDETLVFNRECILQRVSDTEVPSTASFII